VALIRSSLFTFFFYLGSVPLVLAALIGMWLRPNSVIAGSRRWALWHRWCARCLLGVEAGLEGRFENAPALYVFKHESMFEAVELLCWFDQPAVVMKQELVDLPAWGALARAHGAIPVNREAGAAAMRRMLVAARAAMAAGRPIVLFPEGTRVPHGEQPPLRAGFAGLYKLLGLPVIPVALDSGRIWPRGLVKQAGVVRVRIGETIPPGLPREEAECRVRRAINSLNQ
jgi:1-acyl-sn-glycerol-3-phosphate acyltransferase